MSDKNQNIPIKFSFYESIICILYLCIGFIPNLQAIDKIAPQWLFMGSLNIITAIFILKNRARFDEKISLHFKSWLTVLYSFFIIWGGLSFFYAINPTEVLVNISRQFNVFFMYTNMFILLSSIDNKENFFSYVLTIILALETYFVFDQAWDMINASGEIISGNLKGVTANRNIAAFSIALKIPFVLFLLTKAKKIKIKVLGIIIITLAITALSTIQSRASYLAIGLVAIVYFLTPFLFYKEKNNAFKVKMILLIFIPLILSISINQLFFASKGADAVSRASTISFSTNDGSVNQRLRYYSHVLSHLTANPILGVGLGNWKFKSIEYDKKNMSGYVVPYHAHSDFIQLGAELGILGFCSYLGIFLLALFFSLKILFKKNIKKEKRLFIYFTLTSLGVYFIDANLNFPIARPQVIIVWSLIIALIAYYYNSGSKKTKINDSKKFNLIILSSILLISLPSLFISIKVYESLKNQIFLLSDFNTNNYNTKISRIEAMDLEIPNVTVTTIPLKSIKARYYLNNKQYDKALKSLEGSSKPNPFLYFTENMKSRIFQAKGNTDSAYHYSKIAFFGLPNNSLHVANFVKLAMKKKDTVYIKKAADQLLDNQSQANWQNIITAYIDIVGAEYPDLMKLTNRAVELFPKNQNFLLLRKLAFIKPSKIRSGVNLAKEALPHFQNKQYAKAASYYLEAAKEDPMEYSYLENAATCFYQLKDYGNSMLYSSKVINSLNPGTGKSEYLHGISKIAMGDLQGGCNFISKAIELNYQDAFVTQKQFCIN